MTTVVLQSLPQFCEVCGGSEFVALYRLGQDSPEACWPIMCPHCRNPNAFRELLAVIAGCAP